MKLPRWALPVAAIQLFLGAEALYLWKGPTVASELLLLAVVGTGALGVVQSHRRTLGNMQTMHKTIVELFDELERARAEIVRLTQEKERQ